MISVWLTIKVCGRIRCFTYTFDTIFMPKSFARSTLGWRLRPQTSKGCTLIYRYLWPDPFLRILESPLPVSISGRHFRRRLACPNLHPPLLPGTRCSREWKIKSLRRNRWNRWKISTTKKVTVSTCPGEHLLKDKAQLGDCNKFYFTLECEFEFSKNSRTDFLFAIYRTSQIRILMNKKIFELNQI